MRVYVQALFDSAPADKFQQSERGGDCEDAQLRQEKEKQPPGSVKGGLLWIYEFTDCSFNDTLLQGDLKVPPMLNFNLR